MLDSRLPLALDGGGLEWPAEGLIAVFGPPADADLDGIPKDRAEIIQDFYPANAAWQARGYSVALNSGDAYSAAVVCLPRAKLEARAMIAEACALSDGIVVIDGQKTDGIEGILKAMKARVTVHGPITKAHGKLFWIEAPAADCFADWEAGPELTEGGFWTAPGVFSADGVDLASALLADELPEKLGKQVCDLGAGWGFLSAHVLTREDVEAVHLVEANNMALECARRNVTDPRAEFHWADATDWAPSVKMDTVVMNPPFHVGRAAEPQIGQAFVASAARLLAPQGHLWMVANRHLPYEAELKTRFAQVEEIGGDARFKLFHASRPLRKRR
ncbi:class I SAM-dependent methyltransferase [Sulfitobacter donghicola]|uniref:MFS transporter n=1 Tax=Sulfitobacter donghicola DSW-25 = KCTC 12864 = JCM 14565 TaxID=1300350 RepID=A0A073IMH0_9RHOB|nr:class I SAM-dependent methyltransferase [Sulfitobacter donghicola]KEJ90944.1 MFS transporter [Sulfitobacter donghicola DSW-25 = KCTC 12864 = JCM 14565]KIN68234.1 Ribosomal RNA small subunit methyltransferase C [Sulfitobacter donghicola DSW-25 = KCTC 12864 = JCM 14565]